jgi:hypothetical protein
MYPLLNRTTYAMNKPVWQIAIEEMLKVGDSQISRSHFGLLDTIGIKATHTRLPKMHPLNRHVAVLNALEKSTKFKKSWLRLDRRSRAFTPLENVLIQVQQGLLAQGATLSTTGSTAGCWTLPTNPTQ